MPFSGQIYNLVIWTRAEYNKFTIKKKFFKFSCTLLYLIQSLVNDQNWIYSQRHSAIEAVNSSHHLTNYQQMLEALLMHEIINWAYSGIIIWHHYRKSCFHLHCEKMVMQNHRQQMFKQHWSSQITAAHKSFVFHLTITRPQHTTPDTVHCPDTSVFCKGRVQHPFLYKRNSTCPRTSCRSLGGWGSIGWHIIHIECFTFLSPYLLVFFSPKKLSHFSPNYYCVMGITPYKRTEQISKARVTW